MARSHLRAAGEAGLADVYRRQPAADEDVATVATAVAGLGETGVAADAVTLDPSLSHADPRVRRAAPRAVVRLDNARHEPAVWAALSDPSAREVVVGRRHPIGADRLRVLLESDDRPHVRRVALSLVPRLLWWNGAPLLVAAAGSPDDLLRDRAVSHLLRWQQSGGRLAVRPTPAQPDGLERAYRSHGDTARPPGYATTSAFT